MSSYTMFPEGKDSTLATSSKTSWYDYGAVGPASTMSTAEGIGLPTRPEVVTRTSNLISVTDIVDKSVLSSPYTPDVTIVLSIIIGVVILVTVVGNFLVVVAFLTTPKLRTYNNYFILGLAIGDLLVGVVDMPLFATVIVMGQWPFGGIFCDIFTYIDHVFSHISILLVTLISLDRCIAVTYPLRHRQRWRRRSRAILIIAVSYIIPVVIWLPLTALWQVVHGNDQRPIPEDVCEPLYITSVVASIMAPVIFFFIPFTITTILCVRIYVVIKSFYKARKNRKFTFTDSQTQNTPSSAIAGETGSDIGCRDTTASVSISSKSHAIDVGHQVYLESKNDEKATEMSKGKSTRDEKKDKIGRESMKGVRTLVFIVTAMWIAWFPSVLVVITSSICSTCVPGFMYSVVIFWGYTNSLMNPICYALADEAFKDCFTRILTLRCLKKDNNLSRGASIIYGRR